MGLFLLWMLLLGIGCRYWERMEECAAPSTAQADASRSCLPRGQNRGRA